jgi:hypothetical protein
VFKKTNGCLNTGGRGGIRENRKLFRFFRKGVVCALTQRILFSNDEVLRFYRKITEINFQQITVDNEKNGGAFYYTTAFII